MSCQQSLLLAERSQQHLCTPLETTCPSSVFFKQKIHNHRSLAWCRPVQGATVPAANAQVMPGFETHLPGAIWVANGVPALLWDSTMTSPTAPPANFSEVTSAGSCLNVKVNVCKEKTQLSKWPATSLTAVTAEVQVHILWDVALYTVHRHPST